MKKNKEEILDAEFESVNAPASEFSTVPAPKESVCPRCARPWKANNLGKCTNCGHQLIPQEKDNI